MYSRGMIKPMPYRRFSERVERQALEWHQNPVEQDWTVLDAVASRHHSTSPHWATKGDMTAVLKPGPDVLRDDWTADYAATRELSDIFDDKRRQHVSEAPVAAIEKIASDMAYIAGLPVPPVALYRNPALDKTQPHHFACLSLNPFDGDIISGKSSLKHLEGDDLTGFIRAYSAMSVFKGWFDNTDPNLKNVIVDSKTYAAAFPDFSISSLAHWKAGKPFKASYVVNEDVISKQDVRNTFSIIQDISKGDIMDVVDNIPDDFLSGPDKELMYKGLLYRRDNLATLVQKSDLVLSGNTAESAASLVIQRRQRIADVPEYDRFTV